MRKAQNILICISLMLGGCSSLAKQASDIVFMPNKDSARTADESTNLTLYFKPKPQKTGPASVNAVGLAATAILDQVSTTLTEEAKRYTATYSAAASSDQFYMPNSNEIALVGLKFERRINVKKNDSGKSAMSFCAVAVPGGQNEYFRIVPVSHSLSYSKAKLIAFDWLSPFGVDILNPWEVVTKGVKGELKGLPMDDDLDMNVELTLSGLWYDKNGEAKTKALQSQSWKYSDTELSNENNITFKDDGFPCDATVSADEFVSLSNRLANKNSFDSELTSIFPIVPKLSKGSKTGLFSLKVSVTEVDDYGTRIKEINDAFDKQKEGWLTSVNDTFQGSN